MKKTLLATAFLLALSTSSVMAHDGQDAALTYAIKHANFMPTLMMHAIKNADTLELNAEQKEALKAYSMKNSPDQQADMKKVVELEKQAAEAGLNKDLGAAQVAGDKAIALRQSIFNQKLECYKKIQSTLTPAQYDQLKGLLPAAQH